MNTVWSLDPIYKGLDDPAYEADVQASEQLVKEYAEVVSAAQKAENVEDYIEKLLLLEEEMSLKLYSLHLYLMLRQSVDQENGEVMAQSNRVNKILASSAPSSAAAEKIYAQITDIDALAAKSEVVKAYTFKLKETKESAKYLLSDDVEEMISAMNMTGGGARGQLQS